jgi:hypothetical protein
MEKRLSVEEGEHAEKNCGLVGKNQRGQYVDWPVSRQSLCNRPWIGGIWHSPLSSKEAKMNTATILFTVGVMAVAAFGIYLSHKEKHF